MKVVRKPSYLNGCSSVAKHYLMIKYLGSQRVPREFFKNRFSKNQWGTKHFQEQPRGNLVGTGFLTTVAQPSDHRQMSTRASECLVSQCRLLFNRLKIDDSTSFISTKFKFDENIFYE